MNNKVLGVVTLVSCFFSLAAHSTALLAAAGVGHGASIFSPLVLTYDGNQGVWTFPDIKNAPISGELMDSFCAGGNQHFCLAVGSAFYTNADYPLIAMSDAENNWKMQTVPHKPKDGAFLSISCTQDAIGVCVAMGDYLGVSQTPLLALTTNGGKTWQIKDLVTNTLKYGALASASCTGSGANAICVGVGVDFTPSDNRYPLLIISSDDANTWHQEKITGLQDAGFLNQVQCTGSYPNAHCVAVGYDLTENPLQRNIITVSSDNGVTWNNINIQDLQLQGELSNVSCAKNGTEDVCVAAGGEDYIGSTISPELIVSHDGGNHWENAKIANLPEHGEFKSTSCVDTGSSITCVAVGSTRLTDPKVSPFIAVSNDSGKTWTLKKIFGLFNNSYLSSVNCMNDNSLIRCTAVGAAPKFLQKDLLPLVVSSIDSGNHWKIEKLNNSPSQGELKSIRGAI